MYMLKIKYQSYYSVVSITIFQIFIDSQVTVQVVYKLWHEIRKSV